MGILGSANIPNFSESSDQTYSITMQSDGNHVMFKNGVKYLVDTESYIHNYCKKIVGNTYSSALVFGLGLGIIPYYMINNCGTNTIDVVEIDSEMINYITQLNYLDFQKINVIQADALTYSSQSTYDIIIVDIYFGTTDNYTEFGWNISPNELKQILIDNYNKNLNTNGKFYSPIDYTYLNKT